MANVTNHMLRKKLAEMTRESRAGVIGLSTTTSTNVSDTEELILQEKKITKMQGNTLIAEDNTKAVLLNPLPSVKYKCIGVANGQGLIFLEKPFTATIIGDGKENNTCIGVTGDSDEFEIIVDCGDTEVHINNTFISTQTKCKIENGVEKKDE